MPTIPAGFLEATFIFRVTGLTRDSTWSLGMDDDSFASHTPVDMATTIRSAFVASGRPYAAANVQTGWTFKGVSVTKMIDTGPLIGQSLSDIVGTMTGGPVPPNSSILMNKSTDEGGRRGRGRAFLPPVHIGESGIDQAGFMTAANASAITAFYDAAAVALNTAGYHWVLFHSSSPFTPTPITANPIQTQLATQRRRMR